MKFRACLAVLFVVTVNSHAAYAAETRVWAPYAELHSIFAKFLAVPSAKRDQLVFHLGAKPPAGVGRPDDVQLAIVSNGTARRILIDRDWRLQFPLEERLLRENPAITTNLPLGKPLVLRPQITFVPQPGRVWSAVALANALTQANDAVRAQAGMFALFAPKAKSVVFHFADPASSIRVEDTVNNRTLSADSEGNVEVVLDNKMVRNGARLQLSAIPISVAPRFPMSMALTVDADGK